MANRLPLSAELENPTSALNLRLEPQIFISALVQALFHSYFAEESLGWLDS